MYSVCVLWSPISCFYGFSLCMCIPAWVCVFLLLYLSHLNSGVFILLCFSFFVSFSCLFSKEIENVMAVDGCGGGEDLEDPPCREGDTPHSDQNALSEKNIFSN